MEMNLTISLSESLKAWVDQRITSGGYASASAVVEDLLQKEWEREAMARLEDELENILDGPEARRMTPEDWELIRSEGRRRADERRKK